MNVVDTAKAQVKQIVEKVTDKVTEAASTQGGVQAVTIGRPRHEVIDKLRNADFLTQVFGDVADVHESGPERLRWTFRFDGSDGPAWECVVATEGDTQLRFVDVNPDRSAGIVMDLRDAPQDRGTEVIARVTSPAPGALTGALTFKALYRARALLMTGEVPTIKWNPSARGSDR
ncbi:hypothetical protein [Mycobacterium sp. 1274761.0]|uniref:hypothetical protein n=1 Tax=Mycobacterium sp. 1274761.0 TaxID=1834077 RepID=UPI0007FDFB7D|nr:hypothetical protein [Mycobacterium sp. 1274761.0]OBK78472.1 hypothetical protein A5651_02690 [Mycobacterium sp. 1274761.0]